MSDTLDTHEATVRTLELIYDAFGLDPLDDWTESRLYKPVAEGRLLFDNSDGHCDYKLARPLELKNKDRLEYVSFREPSGSELEYIRQGVRAGGTDGLDLGELVTMTLRALIKTGGLAVGIADRIKGRDVDALREMLLELGFFLR